MPGRWIRSSARVVPSAAGHEYLAHDGVGQVVFGAEARTSDVFPGRKFEPLDPLGRWYPSTSTTDDRPGDSCVRTAAGEAARSTCGQRPALEIANSKSGHSDVGMPCNHAMVLKQGRVDGSSLSAMMVRQLSAWDRIVSIRHQAPSRRAKVGERVMGRAKCRSEKKNPWHRWEQARTRVTDRQSGDIVIPRRSLVPTRALIFQRPSSERVSTER